MLKRMVLNVAVGAALTLVVFKPQEIVDFYLNTHAIVVQIMQNLV